MNSIEKFRKLLDCAIEQSEFQIKRQEEVYFLTDGKYLDSGTIEDAIDMLVVANNLKRFLTPESEWEKRTDVFVDFCELSAYLYAYDLNARDCFNIIKHFVKYNVSIGALERPYVDFPDSKIAKKQFKYYTTDEFIDLIHSFKLYEVLTSKDEELDDFERAKKEELMDYIFENQIDENSNEIIILTKNLTILKDCLLANDEQVKEADVDKIIEAFSELGVDDVLIDKLKVHLIKVARRSKQEGSDNSEINLPKKENQKKYLSDKEYRSLMKELRQYFDFYKLQKIRDLSEDEIAYCLQIAYRLGLDESDIMTFLLRSDVSDNEINPYDITALALFSKYYDKFMYYAKKDNFEDHISGIKEMIGELIIANDEDYLIWKNMISEEVNKIMSRISHQYDYEINIAKKTLR